MFILISLSILSTLLLINMWVGDMFGMLAVMAGGELNIKAMKAKTSIKYALMVVTAILWAIVITTNK